jgi:hypothetical protein
MRGVRPFAILIVQVAFALVVGVLAAGVANSGLANSWVRGIVSTAVGIAISAAIVRNSVARYRISPDRPRGSEPD